MAGRNRGGGRNGRTKGIGKRVRKGIGNGGRKLGFLEMGVKGY